MPPGAPGGSGPPGTGGYGAPGGYGAGAPGGHGAGAPGGYGAGVPGGYGAGAPGGYGAGAPGGYGAGVPGGYGAGVPGGYGPPKGGLGYAQGTGAATLGGGPELTAQEDEVARRAATWAHALAILGFVQAGFQLLSANIIAVAVSLGIASALYRGAGRLRAATQTQGHDIHHLVHALEAFGNAFHIRIILTLILLGLVVMVGFPLFLFAALR